jgi:FkbM family methyltransferase
VNSQGARPLVSNAWLLALVALAVVIEIIRLVNSPKETPAGADPQASLQEAAPPTAPTRSQSQKLFEQLLSQDLALQARLEPVSRSSAQPSPRPNIVPREMLDSRLLSDREEMARYLSQFPRNEYEVATVPGLGKFYLDDQRDFLKDYLRKGRMWDAHIADWLRRLSRPGSTAIDAGAHIGVHTVTIAKALGPDGVVYAFEPQKKLFRELYHNLKLNNLDNAVPLRFALGDQPGIIEMNPASLGNEGGTAIGTGGDQAELRTIDSFEFQNVSLIKIDVEGYEDPVLEGARKTIETQKPFLVIEIQGSADFDTAPPPLRDKIVSTIQKIEAMGYRVLRESGADYVCVPQ